MRCQMGTVLFWFIYRHFTFDYNFFMFDEAALLGGISVCATRSPWISQPISLQQCAEGLPISRPSYGGWNDVIPQQFTYD